MEIADKAIRLSPRDPALPSFYFHKTYSYFMMQQDVQVIEWARRSLAAQKREVWSIPRLYLAAALALNGSETEAREIIKHYLSLPGVEIRSIRAFAAWLYLWSQTLRTGRPSSSGCPKVCVAQACRRSEHPRSHELGCRPLRGMLRQPPRTARWCVRAPWGGRAQRALDRPSGHSAGFAGFEGSGNPCPPGAPLCRLPCPSMARTGTLLGVFIEGDSNVRNSR